MRTIVQLLTIGLTIYIIYRMFKSGGCCGGIHEKNGNHGGGCCSSGEHK